MATKVSGIIYHFMGCKMSFDIFEKDFHILQEISFCPVGPLIRAFIDFLMRFVNGKSIPTITAVILRKESSLSLAHQVAGNVAFPSEKPPKRFELRNLEYKELALDCAADVALVGVNSGAVVVFGGFGTGVFAGGTGAFAGSTVAFAGSTGAFAGSTGAFAGCTGAIPRAACTRAGPAGTREPDGGDN